MDAITLPLADEMMARLVAVDSLSHLQERFYPLLTKVAGQERTGEGLALLLMLSAHTYTAELPPFMATVMQLRLHQFVPALTDDENTRAAAYAHLRAGGLPAGPGEED